jgi:hypothetical protein
MDRQAWVTIIQEGIKLISAYVGRPKPRIAPAVTGYKEPGQDSRRVTTDETIQYQKREIAKELTLLEGHLQASCKINAKPCDCCEKHPIKIEALALEGAGMSTDPVFTRLADWAQRISPITTEDAVGSGKYDDEYPKLAIKAREFRKAIMPAAPVKEVADGETVSGTEVG